MILQCFPWKFNILFEFFCKIFKFRQSPGVPPPNPCKSPSLHGTMAANGIKIIHISPFMFRVNPKKPTSSITPWNRIREIMMKVGHNFPNDFAPMISHLSLFSEKVYCNYIFSSWDRWFQCAETFVHSSMSICDRSVHW